MTKEAVASQERPSGDERIRYEQTLKFEHQLINRRLTWLLTSQSVLFAAYGFATQTQKPSEVFLLVTPIAAIAISCLIFIGVACGALAKYTAFRDARDPPLSVRQFGVRSIITYTALVPDLLLPLVFAGAWVWILTGSDVLQWAFCPNNA